eukprot:3551717-Alexandrium_andersonii.AAC.1
MKAQGVQRRMARGARESRNDCLHRQASPRHGAVLGVREAQRGLGRHSCKENGGSWGGQVRPEATLGLGHGVDGP